MRGSTRRAPGGPVTGRVNGAPPRYRSDPPASRNRETAGQASAGNAEPCRQTSTASRRKASASAALVAARTAPAIAGGAGASTTGKPGSSNVTNDARAGWRRAAAAGWNAESENGYSAGATSGHAAGARAARIRKSRRVTERPAIAPDGSVASDAVTFSVTSQAVSAFTTAC